MSKFWQTEPEMVIALYEEQKLSLYVIARRFKTSPLTVMKFLIEYGVSLRLGERYNKGRRVNATKKKTCFHCKKSWSNSDGMFRPDPQNKKPVCIRCREGWGKEIKK